MRNFEEATITDAVLQRVRAAKHDRVRQVSEALVRHLHAFVREIEPTQAEWEAGVDFLTRTGKMCDDKRQEFILLSDTLGVSMLVDAVNHRTSAGATESTIFGPFYRSGAQELPYGGSINLDGGGEPAVVSGRVLATDGTPIANSMLDVWETNENGMYDQQDQAQSDMNLRGKFRTDEHGRYKFVGIRPVPYPIPDDGPVGEMLRASGRNWYRAAHIHLIISAAGYVPVTT